MRPITETLGTWHWPKPEAPHQHTVH